MPSVTIATCCQISRHPPAWIVGVIKHVKQKNMSSNLGRVRGFSVALIMVESSRMQPPEHPYPFLHTQFLSTDDPSPLWMRELQRVISVRRWLIALVFAGSLIFLLRSRPLSFLITHAS